IQQLFVTAFQEESPGGGAQHFEQVVAVPRLDEEAKDLALVDGVDGLFQLGKPGHHEPDGPRRMQSDPLQKLDTADVRHLQTGENEVDLPAGKVSMRSFSAVRREHFEFRAEKNLQRVEYGGVVVYYQERALKSSHRGAHICALGEGCVFAIC